MGDRDPTPALPGTRDWIPVVAIPLATTAVLVALYFSGVDLLRQIVAPDANREYGVLETLQHLLLLGIAGLAAVRAWRLGGAERVVYGVVCLGALFVFLEEVDYGLHWWESLHGTAPEDRATVRNLHNRTRASGDEVADLMKKGTDVGLVVLFVILPLLRDRVPAGWRRRLVPSRLFLLLMAGAFGLSRLAHALDDAGLAPGGSLTKAIGEFRELLVYWAGWLYLRRLPVPLLEQSGPAEA